MKKSLFVAGIPFVLLACTNHTNHSSTDSDSANHESHNNINTNTMNDSTNAITATMDKMMHAMHGAEATGDNDIDFAAMMVEHHRGAVEMSRVELQKGNNAELKAFAQTVIDDQNREITLMQDFASKASKNTSGNSAEFQKALNSSMMAMMNDKTIIYNDVDKDFAAQMIPHHQSAVDMAKAYLKYGSETNLVALCKNIISSQTKEIDWLKAWLAKNGK